MNPNRNITPEYVYDMHEQGLSVAQIAAKLRISPESVEYLLDRAWLRWAEQYGYDN